MKKGLFTFVLLGALLLGGVIVFSILSINPIIKNGVEFFGPRLTQADVRLAESDISLFSGEGTLRGLFVGNPEGFDTDSAIQVGSMSMVVDKDSFSQDKIVIRRIEIEAPRITYERSGRTSNIDTLLANVKRAAGAEEQAREARSGGEAGADGAEGGPRLLIKDLYIRDAELTMAVREVGGSGATTSLPDLHLRDIGAGEGGATPAQALEEVLAALTGSAGNAADRLARGLQQGADGLRRGAEALGKELDSGIRSILGE